MSSLAAMRFVPTSIHGSADYLVGLVVLALPFFFGWTGTSRYVLVGLALFAFIYSLCTDYELGVMRVLSMRAHLLLDLVFGVAMLLLLWLFHLPKPISVIGVSAIFLVLTTKLSAGDPLRR